MSRSKTHVNNRIVINLIITFFLHITSHFITLKCVLLIYEQHLKMLVES